MHARVRLTPFVFFAAGALLACSPGAGGAPGPASASRAQAAPPNPAPSPSLPPAVWVLSTVGLNLRSQPGTQAQVVTTVGWGERLQVSGATDAEGGRWLHVRLPGGTEGWVASRVGDSDTVTGRPMSQHWADSGLYRNLFPSDWSLQKGNPATFTSPPTDPEGATFTVQTADDTARLPKTPTSPGSSLRDEGPVLVYGLTEYFTVFKLDAGGYEFVLKMKAGRTAYLFDYRQSGHTQPDTSLYRTLLGTVILTPA